MVPDELVKIFDEYDYEDLNLCITKVDYSSEVYTVCFDIKSQGVGDLNDFDMKWAITASGHKDSKISFDYAANIDIKEDHPLLWKYNDLQCELYFNGRCQEPSRLFVYMYDIHHELFRNYTSWESFLNSNHLYRLLQADNGLLARGPEKLLIKYAECIRKHGLDYSIIGERTPTFWTGESFVPENPGLKILFMTETDTYIIAENFLFSRQQ